MTVIEYLRRISSGKAIAAEDVDLADPAPGASPQAAAQSMGRSLRVPF